MLNVLKEKFIKESVEFKENLIWSDTSPHTSPIEMLERCSDGVRTAEYYFAARYFDVLDHNKAEGIISELTKLQERDKCSKTYGCMRWYREETFITDTNGAFFILLPLALTYKLCYNRITDYEKQSIMEMLEFGGVWFKKETQGSIHYSNKIMSDGAILTLINSITDKYEAEYRAFWDRWFEYEETRGWGWGENASDVYSNVMIAALNVAFIAAKDSDIKIKLEQKRNKLLDYITFHGGKPFVPSVRTYNFSGEKNYGGYIYKVFNDATNISGTASMRAIIMAEAGMTWNDSTNNENVRRERLFDDSYAYTWKGDNIRLGSVSKFPVMKHSYQRNGWGLAWQSMPVSALIEDTHVSFLRVRAKVNGHEHSHPAVNKHEAFLYNRIFEDGNFAQVTTLSAQDGNIAVVARSINKLANTAKGLYDEWCVPKGSKGIRQIEVYGRKWFVVLYDKNAIAISQLGGYAYNYDARGEIPVDVISKGDFQTICATLYSGDEKMLFAERVESAWVIIAFESAEGIEDYLKTIKISDEEVFNYHINVEEHMVERKIVCSDNNHNVVLTVKPDEE